MAGRVVWLWRMGVRLMLSDVCVAAAVVFANSCYVISASFYTPSALTVATAAAAILSQHLTSLLRSF